VRVNQCVVCLLMLSISRFDNLSGSHLQSQVISVTSVNTIRTPVVDVIGQLIRDVIGRLSVEP